MRKSRIVVVAMTLVASCVGAKLSSTDQDVVTVLDSNGATRLTSYSFGAVSGSATHMFEIGPDSFNDDDILQTIKFQNACPDFTVASAPPFGVEICGGALPPSPPIGSQICQTFPFSVTFTPQSAGSQSCNLVITANPANGSATSTLSFAISGSGSAAALAFIVTPTTIDFGTVSTGAPSNARAFTVKNTGTQAIAVTESQTPSGAYAFLPAIGPQMIAPGAKQIYAVTCNNPLVGTNDSTVTFSVAGIPSQTLTLTCAGTATQIAVNPNPIDFGAVSQGSVNTPIPVSIHNAGATAFTISNIALASGASSDVALTNVATSTALAAGATLTNAFTVTYSAATLQDVGPLGTVTFNADAAVFGVPISGGSVSAAIGTNPASVDLGPVCPNRTASQNVEVYASGKADVMLSLDTMMPVAAPFAATLPAGVVHGSHTDTSTLAISVHPGSADLGPLTGEVVIDTTIPSEPKHTLDVAAIGVPAGVGATPTTVDFGSIIKDTTSTVKRVDFSNCSGTSVSVTGAKITGPDASSFTIVSPAGGGATQLDDAKSETFLIVMSPHSSGAKTAQLDIANSGPDGITSIPLAGVGTEPQVDRQTFYACSSSGPGRGASWPVGAALFAITIGRRRRAKARARTSGYPSAG